MGVVHMILKHGNAQFLPTKLQSTPSHELPTQQERDHYPILTNVSTF